MASLGKMNFKGKSGTMRRFKVFPCLIAALHTALND
jgi:hypothetical protein